MATIKEFADINLHEHCMKIFSQHPNRDGEMRAIYTRITKESGKPTTIAASILIDYYGKSSLYANAKVIYDEAKEAGIVPGSRLLHIFARAVEQSREVSYMVYILSEMRLHNIEWNSELGNSG